MEFAGMNMTPQQIITAQAREIAELQKCCTQRGARMQIMLEWIKDDYWEIPTYEKFLVTYPEAKDWFDKDGVPK